MTHRIGVIPGDGTGLEVVAEALKVLDAVREGFDVEWTTFDVGGDRYLRTGLIKSARRIMRKHLGHVTPSSVVVVGAGSMSASSRS